MKYANARKKKNKKVRIYIYMYAIDEAFVVLNIFLNSAMDMFCASNTVFGMSSLNFPPSLSFLLSWILFLPSGCVRRLKHPAMQAHTFR